MVSEVRDERDAGNQLWEQPAQESEIPLPELLDVDAGKLAVSDESLPAFGVVALAKDEVAALICSGVYSWDCGEALAVFSCESGLRNIDNGAGSFGIAQIQAYWHTDKVAIVTGRAFVTVDEAKILLFDTRINLAVADLLHRDSRWWHWRFSESCWG